MLGMGGAVGFAGGGGGGIKSIQSGTIVITNTTATATATISSVSTSNAISVFGGGESIDGTNEVGRIEQTNATTYTATRIGTSNTTTLNYGVIEFLAGILKSLQRGTVTIAAASGSNTATISSVSTAKAYASWLGNAVTDGGGNNRPGIAWYTRANLTNATTVTLSNAGDTAYTKTAAYEVPEYN